MSDPRPTIRLDKWLWHARIVKTRSLAAKLIASPGMRVNSTPITKPAYAVGPGDVLAFALDARVRVLRVNMIGERRGPASEAQTLYEDLSPPPPPPDLSRPTPVAGGRPDKRDRRRFAAPAPDALD